MNLFSSFIVLCICSLLFSCSATQSSLVGQAPSNSTFEPANTNNNHSGRSLFARDFHQTTLTRTSTEHKQQNTRLNTDHNRENAYESMADRELMLSFHRAPSTTDETLMARIAAEDIAFIKEQYTGNIDYTGNSDIETMYLKQTEIRGSKSADPTRIEDKERYQRKNPGSSIIQGRKLTIGMTIAKR